MAIDKDANRKAVSDHNAKKKALGYKAMNVWIDPVRLSRIKELHDYYKTNEELIGDAIDILYVTVKGQ